MRERGSLLTSPCLALSSSRKTTSSPSPTKSMVMGGRRFLLLLELALLLLLLRGKGSLPVKSMTTGDLSFFMLETVTIGDGCMLKFNLPHPP